MAHTSEIATQKYTRKAYKSKIPTNGDCTFEKKAVILQRDLKRGKSGSF